MRNDESFRVSRTADALWGGPNLFVQTAAVCSREKEQERERERKREREKTLAAVLTFR